MSRANAVLLVLAVLYPVGCALLFCGTVGVPGEAMWVALGFALPACAASAVVAARLAGVRMAWAGVGAFALWVALVGWWCRWLIGAAWRSV